MHWTLPEWSDGNLEGMEENPSYRDTVNIPLGGYIVIRFKASNPGWWFAHCHLMLHHMGGTAFAFRVGTHEEVPQPPANYPHSCGVFTQDAHTSISGSNGVYNGIWIVFLAGFLRMIAYITTV